MTDPHISLENVTVEIPIFSAPQHHSLKQRALNVSTGGRLAREVNSVPRVIALDNVSLEIASGSRLGLVGHNGAGKTTLLRVLAGILKPVSGKISVQGTPSLFINPAIGMNPEITGREFITIQSHICGIQQAQIDAQMEEIIAFTELDEFIDLPIRTYSSGMQTRLSFAVATAYHSEIILIDEGLGTGDAAFQQKAAERLNAWVDRAGIVVLASHSPELVNSVCDKIIRLERGGIIEGLAE